MPTITARGVRVEASTRLLKMARASVHDWAGHVDFGLLLSGDKLINNRQFRDALLKLEPEALGGEMEGAGVYAAAQSFHTDWIIIKAICDWADGKKDEHKKERRDEAARNAVAFTFHVLGKGGFHISSDPTRSVPPSYTLAAIDTAKVEAELRYHTDTALGAVRLLIPGLPAPLVRDEVSRVEDQLWQATPVLLTGESGSGKSGIAATLARQSIDKGTAVLLLDARRVAHIKSEADLHHYLSLQDAVSAALTRVAQTGKSVRLIIDQLDSCIGLTSAGLLIELAQQSTASTGVDVVVVSRNTEAHEVKLLKPLVDVGFVEVTSYPLGIDKAEEMLLQLGIPQPQPELIVLGQNLLSLELIGAIKQQQKDFDFSTVLDEVDLWEEYLTALERGELTAMFPTADTFIAVAHRLALAGLKSPDRTVSLGAFPSREEQRLVSCKLLLPERGRSYRFRHDQLQELSWPVSLIRGDAGSGLCGRVP